MIYKAGIKTDDDEARPGLGFSTLCATGGEHTPPYLHSALSDPRTTSVPNASDPHRLGARSVVSCRERGRPGWTNVPIATGGECTAPSVRSTHSYTHETSVSDARWASHRMGGKVSRFLPEGGTLVLAHTSPRSSGLVPACALSGTRGSQGVRRHGKPKCAPRCVSSSFCC